MKGCLKSATVTSPNEQKIDDNSVVTGKNCHILASTITRLLKTWPFTDLSCKDNYV